MLSYNIETVSAYSTKNVTIPAGSKYTIWTDLNTGDTFQVSMSVTGGANNDVDLIVTDPEGKTLVSGRVYQQYSTEITASIAGRYNFEMDNSF
ncbi:MAG: emp24/gp25L/p24 family protein, partial [Thaumarchaeota archaeon]|nr:emp24/gp25L/p24 family protein [Nitrososphaerota archaeon]